MAGKGNNKPPGLPSYSMEMTILDEDLDDGDTLETMPVGAINFGESEIQELDESEGGWREWYPTWKSPQALHQENIRFT